MLLLFSSKTFNADISSFVYRDHAGLAFCLLDQNEMRLLGL